MAYIQSKATGETIHLTDSADSKVLEFGLHGKAEQKQYSGKNELENTATTQTVKGVTFTVNEDKSVTVNGTPSENADFVVGAFNILPNEEYIMSGCPSGGSAYNYFMGFYGIGNDFGSGIKYSGSTEFETFPFIRIIAGQTVNNLTFYPMIRKASITDPTYEPFVGDKPSPSPDYPQDIEVAGASYNLLENTATTQTVNGVTFTVNEDKSVTVNGTANASGSVFNINSNAMSLDLASESYVLSGCPSGGNTSTYRLQFYDGSFMITDYGSGTSFDFANSGQDYNVAITVFPNATVNNLTFYPMIRKASVKSNRYMPYGVGSVKVKSVGKNFLKNTATSRTIEGVTYTVNDNGSVTANGTASKNADFVVGAFNILANKEYILSGCPSGGSAYNYFVGFYGIGNDFGGGLKYSGSTELETFPFIRIIAGQTVNNLTFYPMIRLASDTDDTYEPYTETTSTISTPDGIAGINGVCDEIVKYADGSGKRIQRIGKAVFDGSDDEGWYMTTSRNRYRPTIAIPIKADNTIYDIANILCTHYQAKSSADTYEEIEGIASSLHSVIFIYDSNHNTGELSLWKAHLVSNPITVYYELATPIITDLTAEEIAEIEKLHTFYPVTNISNDADCFMFITYNTFRYEWIEPKTNWKPTDRFNFSDYNRIKSNINWLHQKAQELWKMFSIEDMGEDITSYETYWNVNMFNAFENNLEQINKNIFTKNYGTKQVFFENAPFIQYEELNRIESAMLSMYDILTRQELTIRRIPFRLGTFKEVRI